MKRVLLIGVLAVFLFIPRADAIYDPGTGLAYHLAFVSRATFEAIDITIDNYDRYVQGAANVAGIGESVGISWYAIVSTDYIHARNHAVVSAPVYLLDGTKIADSFDDMWDGTLDAPINRTELNTVLDSEWPATSRVWTGTQPNGLGGNDTVGIGSGVATYGSSNSADSNWVSSGDDPYVALYHLYALSSPLMSVPEPATAGLLGIAGLVITGCRRIRKTYGF